MERLTLNDGTVLEDSNAYQDGNSLYLYIRNGDDLETVFNLLIDPEKTSRIVKAEGEDEKETVFTGFSRLIAVRDEQKQLITAVLQHE